MLHFLELPKVGPEARSSLERWLYYLEHGADEEDEKVKVLLREDETIRATHERYERFTEDDQAREVYEARQKYLHDQATQLAVAREEGVEQGIERGDRHRAVAVARTMKDAGEPLQKIERYTGLSREEIEKL